MPFKFPTTSTYEAVDCIKMAWRDDISKLISKINGRKESEFFREPVDWKGLGLTDYPTIITQPMDLRTVRERLEGDYYDTPLEVAADVRLIFLNAMTYNAPGSRVFVYAKTLSDMWEQNCASILKHEDDVDRPATIDEMAHWVDKCHRLVPWCTLILYIAINGLHCVCICDLHAE